MAQHITVQSRTIHTMFIDIPDDVLGQMEQGNDIEVVLQSRTGQCLAKKLNYRDVMTLLEGDPRIHKARAVKHL